jgi:hypothetical protein
MHLLPLSSCLLLEQVTLLFLLLVLYQLLLFHGLIDITVVTVSGIIVTLLDSIIILLSSLQILWGYYTPKDYIQSTDGKVECEQCRVVRAMGIPLGAVCGTLIGHSWRWLLLTSASLNAQDV